MEKTGRDKIADLTRNIGSCVSLPPILTNSPSIESFISFNAVFVKLVSAYCFLFLFSPSLFLLHSVAGHGNEDDGDNIRRFKFSAPFDNFF